MDLLDSLKRDAQIIQALHVARYALVTHGGLTVSCEGSSWKMDFSGELDEIDKVMEMLGVDLSQPLPAPTKEMGDD